jgi:cytochrome c oxidase subunit IV
MSSHILPKRVYYTIFAILLFCTYLTVQIAFLDLGVLNTVAALAIATFKAALVILFFMHVKYAPRLTQLVVVVAFAFLALLLAGVVNDYYSPGLDGRLGPAHLTRQ